MFRRAVARTSITLHLRRAQRLQASQPRRWSTSDLQRQLQYACGDDSTSVLADSEDLKKYSTDWTGTLEGEARLVVRPSTTEQVQAVVDVSRRNQLSIIPYGGNTGLVGGSVPTSTEIVLSLERINKIRSIDPVSGVVVAEAGVVLSDLDEALSTHGFCAPVDLGAKGSCQIGGNIATNAGGLRFKRYGSLHGTVLGVEAIAGTGERLDMLSELRKDNTGYSVKDLFIGSEGSLGVITAVSIAAPRLAPVRQVALLACPSWDATLYALQSANQKLQGILSAIEFFDAASMEVLMGSDRPFVVHRVRQADGDEPPTYEEDARVATSMAPNEPRVSGVRDPLGERYPFYVLVETRGVRKDHDSEVLEDFLSSALAKGTADTGVFASSEAEADELFAIREGITTALTARGPVLKFDLSFPRTRDMYGLVDQAREWLHPSTRQHGVIACGYGHLGDNNLHLNVSVPSGAGNDGGMECREQIKAAVYDRAHAWTAARGGSISAEHGLGTMKNQLLPAIKPRPVLEVMQQLKAVFDPDNIMNPGRGVLHPGTPFDEAAAESFRSALATEKEAMP